MWWAFWLFCGFFVMTSPEGAANVVEGIGKELQDGAVQVQVFVAHLL
jgi:hypothetical protein